MNTPGVPLPPPDDFIARGLASRDRARKSGHYIPASEVLRDLASQLDIAKSQADLKKNL